MILEDYGDDCLCYDVLMFLEDYSGDCLCYDVLMFREAYGDDCLSPLKLLARTPLLARCQHNSM
jgi:hypothetical protein